MNKPTPGIWKRFYEFIEDDKGNTIISCSGENTESEQDEANATFVVTAHAACRSINPDNPLAVAEALPELVEAARKTLRGVDSREIPLLEIRALLAALPSPAGEKEKP